MAVALPSMEFWTWLIHTGLIQGSAKDYTTPGRLKPEAYVHAIQTAVNNLEYASDPRVKEQFYAYVDKLVPNIGDPTYYSSGKAPPAAVTNFVNVVGNYFGANPGTSAGGIGGILDPGAGVTDVAPIQVGNATIPQGGQLVRIRNPEGSDEKFLYYIVYKWRGIDAAFEVGGSARFKELFGSAENFSSFSTVSQAGYDSAGYVDAGLIDSELGATESFGSKTERELRALGKEDLPSWLADSPDALFLVATGTAEEWSQGRLWKELSTTGAFQERFGTALPKYLQQGLTIGDAVAQITADENSLRTAIRPFLAGSTAATTDYLQGLLNAGWTPGVVAQVLESAEILRRNPETLAQSNFVLQASGIAPLNEVGFLNALNGYGPQDVIEALNTATAARALEEAGIDLSDADIGLIMELVDTSDRLLTVDSWRQLSQELSFNVARFGHELEANKLGFTRDDLIAGMFGEESPSGRSAGDTLSLLARFERDRRKASQGYDVSSGYQDQEGRLIIQGLKGL